MNRFGPNLAALEERATDEALNHDHISIDTCLALMDAGVDPRKIARVEHIAQTWNAMNDMHNEVNNATRPEDRCNANYLNTLLHDY